jgi:hypothetical protein
VRRADNTKGYSSRRNSLLAVTSLAIAVFLIRARPRLALADQAAERAALEIERPRVHERDRTAISLAVPDGSTGIS